MDLSKFRPGRAVKVLLDEIDPNFDFIKPWVLAQLLAWIALDQRAGTRKKMKRRSRNAKNAGHHVLMTLLDREVRQKSSSNERFRALIALFMETGGFAACQRLTSARSILNKIKAARSDVGYVYQIVDYLCRFSLDRAHVSKHLFEFKKSDVEAYFSIESAKAFVDHQHETGYKISAISKRWEKYKSAAAYIYAFHDLAPLPIKSTSDDVVDWLICASADRSLMAGIFGRAAFAADILAKKARNVRQQDFEGVPRVSPQLRPFSKQELDGIISTARDFPIA